MCDINMVSIPDIKVDRCSGYYENHSSKYTQKSREFSHQYAHAYSERLKIMRPMLTTIATQKWKAPVRRLYELAVNEECIIIGTLYKHMDLKPGILKQLADEAELLPAPFRKKYTDCGDRLVLEDELQRISLEGDIDAQTFITGTVIAVRGQQNENGKFQVCDYTLAGYAQQPERKVPDDDRYVLLVSGLSLGDKGYDPLSLDLLIDTVCGEVGGVSLQEGLASKIVRVIIAGNSLSKETQNRDIGSKAKYLTKKVNVSTVEPMKELDSIIERLVSSVPVDIMPGQHDPSNRMMPQQPLHRCMFPKSSLYNTFQAVTNPYEADILHTRFLGTSGEQLDDIFRFSLQSKPVEMLEFLLRVSHLAPSAPDTLASYPFYNEDPFIINACPHVFFASNQQHFAFKKVTDKATGAQVMLICVPKFNLSHTAVLVNLKSLDCQPVVIDTHFSETVPKENMDVSS